MGLETGTFIDDLIVTNPLSTDKRRFGDDHLRLIKKVLKNSFPTIDGAVVPSLEEINFLDGVTSAVQAQIDAKVDPGDIANSAEKDEQNTFVKGQATEEVDVTFSTTIELDASLSNAFRVIATNNFTFDPPINGIKGQVLTLFIEQDATGDRVITYGTGLFGSAADDLVLTTVASKVDLMTLLFGGSLLKWYVVGLKKDIHSAL